MFLSFIGGMHEAGSINYFSVTGVLIPLREFTGTRYSDLVLGIEPGGSAHDRPAEYSLVNVRVLFCSKMNK